MNHASGTANARRPALASQLGLTPSLTCSERHQVPLLEQRLYASGAWLRSGSCSIPSQRSIAIRAAYNTGVSTTARASFTR